MGNGAQPRSGSVIVRCRAMRCDANGSTHCSPRPRTQPCTLELEWMRCSKQPRSLLSPANRIAAIGSASATPPRICRHASLLALTRSSAARCTGCCSDESVDGASGCGCSTGVAAGACGLTRLPPAHPGLAAPSFAHRSGAGASARCLTHSPIRVCGGTTGTRATTAVRIRQARAGHTD